MRDYYGFSRPPFGALTDAAQFFLSDFHRRLVQGIVVGVLHGRSVTAVRGGRGVGKTSLMRVVASELEIRGVAVAEIAASQQTPGAVQRRIGEALGIAGAESLKPDEMLRILPAEQGAQSLVLLFDDADTLSNTMYRYLSLLIDSSNFGITKIRLVLFGQLGQWLGVGHADLETLREATLSSIVIPHLSTADAASYLDHKLSYAGRPLRRVMTKAATLELVEHAHGVPAQLDELTDFALWYGHQIGRRRITRKSLRMGMGPDEHTDVTIERRAASSFRTAAVAAGITAVAATVLAWWVVPTMYDEQPATTAANSSPAPEPGQTAALPETHPVDPTVMPAEPPSLPTNNATPTTGTADASAPPAPLDLPVASDGDRPVAPLATPLPAPEPGQTAALPETRPADPTILPAEPPSLPTNNATPTTGTADSSAPLAPLDLPVATDGDRPATPLATPLPAPEPGQTAALPETRPTDPAILPAEPPSLPTNNATPTTGTADASAPPAPLDLPVASDGDRPAAPLPTPLPAPAPGQTAALPETRPTDPTILPAEPPSLPTNDATPTTGAADASAPPAPLDLPVASDGDRPAAPLATPLPAPEPVQTAAMPKTRPADTTILPAEPPSLPADHSPPTTGTADASAPSEPLDLPLASNGDRPAAPLATPLPAPQPDQTAALPEARPVDPTVMPAEPPSPSMESPPPTTGTADATAPLPAPQPGQTAALPETRQVNPTMTPLERPAPSENSAAPPIGTADANSPPAPLDLPTASAETPIVSTPRSMGAPGLVLVAGTGDSLATLYAKMYRGVKPPPYSVFVAANPSPVAPGTLVVFPEPPGGWSTH